MDRTVVKPSWLPVASAAIHLTFAILIVGSVLILLMRSNLGADGGGVIDGWIETVESVASSLAMERRRPYAVSLLGAFAVLPLAVGWWNGRCLMTGRGGCNMRIVAPLAALFCVVLYATAVQMLLRSNTAYLTAIARNHIWFSHVLVAAYGILYVPVAFAAAHLVRHLHRRGQH